MNTSWQRLRMLSSGACRETGRAPVTRGAGSAVGARTALTSTSVVLSTTSGAAGVEPQQWDNAPLSISDSAIQCAAVRKPRRSLEGSADTPARTAPPSRPGAGRRAAQTDGTAGESKSLAELRITYRHVPSPCQSAPRRSRPNSSRRTGRSPLVRFALKPRPRSQGCPETLKQPRS